MNKRGRILIFVLLATFLMFSFVTAQGNESKIDDAIECLEDEIDDTCDNISPEEQIYALLGLGNYDDCREKVLENSRNEECWPSSNCKVKDTAIALLALDNANRDVDKVADWLLNQSKVADDLIWYLQIETTGESSCTIEYDSTDATVTIQSDRRVSSGAGSCLQKSQNGYWLEITSNENCLENEYTISCDQDFTTTLLYQTPQSPTIHVSQNINSESAEGESIEKVIYKCFEQAGNCNYEASLWATLAINVADHDIEPFLPYLTASVEENERFFPEPFIYLLTGDDAFLTSILNDNFNGEFWKVGTLGKWRSTGIALLALGNQQFNEVDDAREYLLSDVQGANGCWNNNFIDTAFLLYSGWPDSRGGGSGGGDDCSVDNDCGLGEECLSGVCVPISGQDCLANSHYCVPSASCEPLGGIEFRDFGGCSTFEVCCSQDLPLCSEKNGLECDFDESCDGNRVESSDTFNCCLGECIPKTTPPSVEYTCETDIDGGFCQSSCFSDEVEDASLSCPAGQICCVTPSSGGGSLWWVWILLILILIVILAIIFRDRVRVVVYKVRNRFKKGPPAKKTRPPFRPTPPPRRPIPGSRRQVLPPRPAPVRRAPPPRKAPSAKDKEFEDTLKKLKDMSK